MVRRRPPRVPPAARAVPALVLAAILAAACVPAAVPHPPPTGPAGLPPGVTLPPTSPATGGAPGPASAAPTAASPAASPRHSPGHSPGPATPRNPRAAPAHRPPWAAAHVARQLQAAVNEFRAASRSPGVSAAIIFPDGRVWTGVAGVGEVSTGEAVTPETAFAVASISKTFVAALALELSGEGAFALEEPVARHLPELALDPAITIRMLLDHTSGLHDYFLHPKIDAALLADPRRSWETPRVLAYVAQPYFAPGTGWRYSNTNYLLLGLLIERVTGRSLAEQLRERFFDPLGLDSAFYQVLEPPRGPLAHGYRLTGPAGKPVATDLWDGSGIVPFRSVVTAAAGAGSVAASSLDVARWARALYGGEAIRSRSLTLMLGGVDRVAGYRPRIPYGLGVQAIPVSGRFSYGHSGRFSGFRAQMRWFPEERLSVAVLTNQGRSDPLPLLARLVEIALPQPDRPPARWPA